MARNKKRKQTSHYIRDATLPPELQGHEGSVRIRKRIKRTHNILYLSFFETSMTTTLRSMIEKKIGKSTDKKLDKNLEKLKDYALNRTTLPPGVIQSASELANQAITEQTGENSVMTSAAYKNRLDNEAPARLIQLWNEFATEERFTTIVEELKSGTITGDSKEEPSTSETLEDENLEYRTCPVSLNKILRNDLDETVANVVRDKLTDAMTNASDFQAQFLSIIQMLSIIIKENSLFVRRGAIEIEEITSVDIAKILPGKYVEENKIKPTFSAPPLSESVKEQHQNELTSLFTEQHLNLIQSYYFGDKGSKVETLQKYPIQRALFDKMETEGIEKGSQKGDCRSEEKVNVMSHLITNIKNMWSKNTIFQKLLDHLLLVLLRIHLAGIREANKDQANEKKKKIKSYPSNHKRNVILLERKKLKKLNQKSNAAGSFDKVKAKERVLRCERRVAYFESLPKKKFSVSIATQSIHQA